MRTCFRWSVRVLVDEDDLAGLDVPDLAEVHDVQADRLRGEGVGGQEAVAPDAEDEGLDAVGIAEGDQALVGDVGDDGIAAPDLVVDGLDGPEDVLRARGPWSARGPATRRRG